MRKDDRDTLINHRMGKAIQLIDEVAVHIQNGHLSTAVNRIYYGMFHALSALALHNEFTTSKHLQLIGWFNKIFIKEQIVDQKYGKILNTAFELRTKGDYDDFIEYSNAEVSQLHSEMIEFISMIRLLIEN